MLALGLACWGQHEAAAAVVGEGKVLAAAEQERFSRRKFDSSLPIDAIRACLETAGCRAADIAQIGFYWHPWHHAGRKIAYFLRHIASPNTLLRGKGHRHLKMFSLPAALATALPELAHAPLRFFKHHECHAASAFLCGPFDTAAVVSLDGAGEWASAWMGRGEGATITTLGEVHWPHSLGHVYAAITEHLGFHRFADEYKVMGLAAYGDPARYRSAFGNLIRLLPSGRYAVDLRYFDYPRHDGRMVSSRFVRRFYPPRNPATEIEARHRDLAAALQERLEQTVAHVVGHAVRATGCERVCLAGGVALNGVAAGRLLRDEIAAEVFIPPAGSDAGCAVGAALLAAGGHRAALTRADLGPAWPAERIATVMEARGAVRCLDPAQQTAQSIAEGRIVGWFQGRMEFGARALGNRSILADPRVAEMKERINARVKFREDFRPFAPAILDERRAEWFSIDHPSPFMNMVLPFRAERRAFVPAVVHADGTGRLQTVTAEERPEFHALISAFHDLTGIPMVLNTSFNVQGEPIVNTPEEALACYDKARLDDLVIEDWVLSR